MSSVYLTLSADLKEGLKECGGVGREMSTVYLILNADSKEGLKECGWCG